MHFWHNPDLGKTAVRRPPITQPRSDKPRSTVITLILTIDFHGTAVAVVAVAVAVAVAAL